MLEITEDVVHGIKEKTGIEKWSNGLRRIATTYCVAEAWNLSTTLPDKQEQVPFQKSGHVSSAFRFCVTSFMRISKKNQSESYNIMRTSQYLS
jgi:hypothetical protein